MAQVFHRSTNLISRLSIYGSVVFLAVLSWALYQVALSAWYTEQNVPREQPVPFSHKHHVSELGIDCRYCHTSVEKSSFAGLPPTHTCMTCHSQIWRTAPILEPVRASYRDDVSISWTRVNALPQFVYFDHSIHIHKGIGCTTCHGPIGEMPLTWRGGSLYMSWCLECHRNPEKYIRPRSQIFNAAYQPPAGQVEMGKSLLKEYNVHTQQYCSTCHR
jgi:hypothetical protein